MNNLPKARTKIRPISDIERDLLRKGRGLPELDPLSLGVHAPNINIPPMPRGPVLEDKEQKELEKMASDDVFSEVEVTFDTSPEKVKEEKTVKLSSTWERIDLPSNWLQYDFSTLNIRKFVIPDLAKLNKARTSQNLTILLDTLDSTIDQDIRDLTIPDWKYLCYWHRWSSYPRTPFKLTWTSKYHNTQEITVNKTILKIDNLQMDRKEFEEFRKLGLQLPTIRDLEILEQDGLSEDMRYYFERAQYISPSVVQERIEELEAEKHPSPSVQARIEYLNSHPDGVSFLETILDFDRKVGKYGVIEKVRLRDTKFDAESWVKEANEKLDKLKALPSASQLEDVLIKAIQAEIQDIEGKLARNEKVEPQEEEEVTLEFSVWHLFPDL